MEAAGIGAVVGRNLHVADHDNLGRWGDPAAVADIVRGLPTLAEQGRLSALDALGRLATPEAEKVLADYAADASPQVRKLVVGE